MNTTILKAADLSLAVDCLKRGEPIAFPTETVYGLGAPVFDEIAIQRVFQIKQRPSDNPLIAHIASLDDANKLATGLNESFYVLASLFWPGPLSIVLPKRPEVPDIVSGGSSSIAIRMPSHPVAKELIEGVGQPLVAPSANLSGRPSPTRAVHVLEDLGGKIRYVVDGGECSVGIESTVISLLDQTPVLLRPGALPREDLERALRQKIGTPAPLDPPLSPGMKYRHYAPKAKLKLVFEEREVRGPHSIKPTTQNLYAELRKADQKGLSEIEIYCNDEVQKNEALMNRLLRAAQ